MIAGTVVAPAHSATPPLKFGRWVVDPAGDDLPANNAKVNREYVVVSNTTSKAIALKGYKVRDGGSKHTYTFGAFTLNAKKSVTLHTGKGKNTASTLYWGQNYYVWNNTGETATLFNGKGAKVASCTYKKSGSTAKKDGAKNC